MDMSLCKPQETVKDREAWRDAVLGLERVRRDLAIEQQRQWPREVQQNVGCVNTWAERESCWCSGDLLLQRTDEFRSIEQNERERKKEVAQWKYRVSMFYPTCGAGKGNKTQTKPTGEEDQRGEREMPLGCFLILSSAWSLASSCPWFLGTSLRPQRKPPFSLR